MKMNKFQSSSDGIARFDNGNEGLNFNTVLPEEMKKDSPLEHQSGLARGYTSLHAAHKGMHPVIFTVLAALHEMLNNKDTVAHLSQGKL